MPSSTTLTKTRNIALPKFGYQRFPLTTMLVGDSFAIRYEGKSQEIKARQRICAAILSLRRNKANPLGTKRFTVRKHENREMRCWRTA